MRIEDLHGNPINPTTPWYAFRKEFREFLDSESGLHPKHWDYEAAQANQVVVVRMGHTKTDFVRLPRKSTEQRLARNSLIITDRAKGMTYEEIGHKYLISASGASKIIKKADV